MKRHLKALGIAGGVAGICVATVAHPGLLFLWLFGGLYAMVYETFD